MASATGVRPAAGLGDAGFSFRSFHFSLWVRSFSGLGGRGRRGGSCWNRAVEYGVVPYPCSPPLGGTRPGSRFWFPPRPSASPAAPDLGSRGISGALTTEPRSSLAPGREPPRESGWRSLSVCPGGTQSRAQPGNLALALPGAVPKGQRRPGESPERAEEPAPLPWAQPRGVFLLLSFRVPTSLDQPKSCSQRCWKGLAHRCCCRARRLLPRQAELAGRPAGRTQVLLQLNFSPHWKPSEFYFLVIFV